MRLIGAYKEFGDGDSALSIRESVGVLDGPIREIVGQYLDTGIQISAVPGYEIDVLTGKELRLTRSFRTDGSFIWRSDLAHYVRTHGVGLDPEFISHVLDRKVPPRSTTDQQNSDLRDWIKANVQGEPFEPW